MIGSVKTNIGHTEALGNNQFDQGYLMLQHKQILYLPIYIFIVLIL